MPLVSQQRTVFYIRFQKQNKIVYKPRLRLMLQITFLQLLTIYQYYKKFEYIVATSEGLFLFLLLTILKGVITSMRGAGKLALPCALNFTFKH